VTPIQRVLVVLGTTVAICAAYAGYLLNEKHRTGRPTVPIVTTTPAPAPASDDALSYWSFSDLEGRERHMSEWAGQLVVVNFWATWCPPCRKEIPAFIDLQQRFSDREVRFVGIALDRVEAVTEYAAKQGMNYPVLVGEENVSNYMRALGNTIGALPYSALIGRDGRVIATHQGEWHEPDVEAALNAAL